MTRPKPLLWFFGGMWFHPDQLRLLKEELRNTGNQIQSSMSGDAHTRDFEMYVENRAAEINASGQDSIFFAHSYGIRSAVAVAEKVQGVRGIICFDPAPHKGIYVPPNPCLFKWHYIWTGLLRGRRFSLTPEDEKIAIGNADIQLVPESGKILRLMACPLLYGFKIPKLNDLPILSLITLSRENGLIPLETSRRIAKYHGCPIFEIDGGHFAHGTPEGAKYFAEQIAYCLKKW